MRALWTLAFGFAALLAVASCQPPVAAGSDGDADGDADRGGDGGSRGDGSSPGEDAGETDASSPDARAVDGGGDGGAALDDADVGPGQPQDAATGETAETSSSAGETCESAGSLAAASLPDEDGSHAMFVEGVLGSRDDYNPYEESGLPPGCSIVYDASGAEVVYAVLLAPGDTLSMRYVLAPDSAPGGLYLLDGCSPPTWPDYDGSGMCGRNEYVSQGYCGFMPCEPLELSFTYPEVLGGAATTPRTFFVVLDEVGGSTATGYRLEWTISPAF